MVLGFCSWKHRVLTGAGEENDIPGRGNVRVGVSFGK